MRTRLLLMGIFFCMITCKREGDSDSQSDELKIGNNSNVALKQYDTVLVGAYYHPATMDLDVNGDNISDFRLISEIWGSPGLGQHPRSTIICLNTNSMILGKLKNDTTYSHNYTNIYTGSNNTIVVNNYHNSTCRRVSSNDPISSIQVGQFKITPQRNGDYINKTDFFKSDSCTLVTDFWSYPSSPIFHYDTTICTYTGFDDTCDSYPSDKISYIGIKIKELNAEKLGWLKISISDTYKIALLESAIQK